MARSCGHINEFLGSTKFWVGPICSVPDKVTAIQLFHYIAVCLLFVSFFLSFFALRKSEHSTLRIQHRVLV